MNKHVVFFEVEGGSDKGSNGYRADTMPMVESLEKKGWSAEAIFYSHEKKDEIFDYVLKHADAYVPRVNPGNLKDEGIFFEMLSKLSENGIVGLSSPDTMFSYGAKDALVKLKDTTLVPDDVFAYYDMETFKSNFPKQLLKGERVLKQNRGSTGQGIWRVELVDTTVKTLSNNTKIKCTEAVDNHVEHRTLGEFMEFCEQYITGKNGMLIDMPFMPRIKEGEIRLIMLHRRPVFVVHKKPADSADAFSATLFSGAKYRYETPDQWPEVVSLMEKNLDNLVQKLGGFSLPLLWTADFMLDTDDKGSDTYVLGEINASCVGFTSQLELSNNIADEIISILTAVADKSY